MTYKYVDSIVAKNKKVPSTVDDYIVYWGGQTTMSDEPVLQTSGFIDSTFISNMSDSDMLESDWFNFVDLTFGVVKSFSPNGILNLPVNIIDSIIYDKYKSLELLPTITDCFEPPFTNYPPTPNTHYDREILENFIHGLTYNTLSKNRKKYEKLFTALTAEFNPLWNVDGTERTIRTLERDGTETTRRTGTVADSKTGTVTDAKTGTVRDLTETSDTLKRTGTDTNVKGGTETTLKTGTVTDAKSGTETTAHTGTDNKTKNGQESTTTDTEKSAFNASTMTPTESVNATTQYTNLQDNETVNLTDLLTLNSSNTQTNNTTDTLTHDVTDTETLNTQDEREIENDTTTTHNTLDTQTHNTTDTVTHNTTDTNTLDTVDTERIEYIRQGNIGVISTVKLLQEYIEFADQLDFFSIIARDIIENIAILTY